jgi:hypothetical protein
MEPKTEKKKSVLVRVNTRILEEHAKYIKLEVRKSNGTLTEGDVHRALLSEAIFRRKAKV